MNFEIQTAPKAKILLTTAGNVPAKPKPALEAPYLLGKALVHLSFRKYIEFHDCRALVSRLNNLAPAGATWMNSDLELYGLQILKRNSRTKEERDK